MATTTFSGPVVSQNGFSTGTVASPLAVTTAQSINSTFVTTSATTGDTRVINNRLTFTSTGSGETARFFSIVTGAGAAATGTINGAHISTSINTTGTISGAANVLRATLGGSAASPGGTLAVIQLDTDYSVNASLPGTASFIRVTDSGANTGEIPNLLNIETGPAATLFTAATSSSTLAGGIKVRIDGADYFLVVASAVA
jgi:hypothetical protein